MKKTVLLAVFGGWVLLLSGAVCVGPPSDATDRPTTDVSFTPSPCPVVRGDPVRDLVAELVVNGGETELAQGEPITMTLALTNCGEEPLTRTYASGQQYDFVVSDGDQQEVWRWSHDKLFIQMITGRTFQPGEMVTYTEVWNQISNEGEQVAPGTYDVLGLDVGCNSEHLSNCHFGMGLPIEIIP